MSFEVTAVFHAIPGGFAAFVEELPDARAEGRTLDEARANLRTAAQALIATRRTQADRELAGSEYVQETMVIASSAERHDLQVSFLGTWH